jgi:hypothetical protein
MLLLEADLRGRVPGFLQAMLEAELDEVLSLALCPPREDSERGWGGSRDGPPSRPPARSLLGSFGQVEIEVPRARLNTPDGKTTERKSKALRGPINGAHLLRTR